MTDSMDLNVTGTLMWYYHICHREVWMMARHIVPDQEHENVDIGRFLQETVYFRDRKEVAVGHLKFDIVKRKGNQLVVGEVKKTSKFEASARMQLALYLYELAQLGLDVSGELLFPKERKRVIVELTPELITKVEQAKRDILRIIYLDVPPPAERGKFCSKCAYGELCWV
jgi:CRISPR-associated exonuclease Cas4